MVPNNPIEIQKLAIGMVSVRLESDEPSQMFLALKGRREKVLMESIVVLVRLLPLVDA